MKVICQDYKKCKFCNCPHSIEHDRTKNFVKTGEYVCDYTHDCDCRCNQKELRKTKLEKLYES